MSGKLLIDTNAVSYFMAGNEVLCELITDKKLFVFRITESVLLCLLVDAFLKHKAT